MSGRKRRPKEGGGFSVWRSYSDMMAGVLLLFILIMCVTLFQAQVNYREKLAEQDEKMRIQDEYSAEMTKKEEELAEQDALLEQQKEKLAEQNLTLDEMREALEEQARILAEKQAVLEEQQAALEEQTAALDKQKATTEKQQTQIEEQQKELAEQQKTLEDQEKELKAQADEIAEKTRQLKEKQEQIDRIVGVKAELIEALQREFTANRVNVNIDPQTGALMLDAKVMFDFDSAQLSEEGKQVLRQVLPIYCRVLLSYKYKGNVAEFLIDGYTDTVGTYEYNLELSQKRSLAVAQFLLEPENGLLTEREAEALREILTVSGHSWNNPILDANGNIDMEASRRVEVKFRLKDEEMIEELRKLTE